MSKIEDAMPYVPTNYILIVEDNPVNMKLATILIKNKNPEWIILEAANGEVAVQMFDDHHPNVILMDIQMPIMNGFEATREIRKMEEVKGGHVPIIALTASILQEDEEECRKAGMDDFLSKPFIKERLYSTLDKWLNSSNL